MLNFDTGVCDEIEARFLTGLLQAFTQLDKLFFKQPC